MLNKQRSYRKLFLFQASYVFFFEIFRSALDCYNLTLKDENFVGVHLGNWVIFFGRVKKQKQRTNKQTNKQTTKKK
jgi:hypothetical protein